MVLLQVKNQMIRDLIRNTSLLFRFSLISLFVILLIAAGLAWRLESTLEKDALQAVAENTAEQANNILDHNLTNTDLKTVLQGQRYQEIDALIHNTLLSMNIVRIKIWNRDGLLVYSDDATIMGKAFPISDELTKAFSGEIATEISLLQAEENISERGKYTRLYEIYVPIQPTSTNKVVGVYEVYYDLSKLQPR